MEEEKGLITKSTLTDIGNAIRAKNGFTKTYRPSEMATAIEAISSGSGYKVYGAVGLNLANLNAGAWVKRIAFRLKTSQIVYDINNSNAALKFFSKFKKYTDMVYPVEVTFIIEDSCTQSEIENILKYLDMIFTSNPLAISVYCSQNLENNYGDFIVANNLFNNPASDTQSKVTSSIYFDRLSPVSG